MAANVNCEDISNQLQNGLNGQDLCNTVTTNTGIGVGVIVTIIIIIVLLPLIYLYWWIVVNSLRKRIMEERTAILPIQQQPPYGQMPPNPPGYETKY